MSLFFSSYGRSFHTDGADPIWDHTVLQCITGYFYNEMRYINLRFTYLLTYLPATQHSEHSPP